jgi:hypothetical protein
MLGDLDLSGMMGVLELNTENGEVRFENVVRIAADSPGFEKRNQTNGPPLSLWNFRSLVIGKDVIVRPSSNSARVIALAGEQAIAMAGTIDLVGRGAVGGPPGANGTTRQSGAASGGGGAQPGMGGPGGGGAGHATMGMMGGGGGGGSPGGTYGSTDLNPVHFGSGGGGGSGTMVGSAGRGGGGGGAIGLFARIITIGGTVDASGARGADANPAATVASGGGGGGSGGSILLSGESVRFMQGHRLNALRGDGGMGILNGMAGGIGGDGRIYIAGPTLGSVMSFPNARIDAMPLIFPR